MGGGPKLAEISIDCALAGTGGAETVKSIAKARNNSRNFVRVVDRFTIGLQFEAVAWLLPVFSNAESFGQRALSQRKLSQIWLCSNARLTLAAEAIV